MNDSARRLIESFASACNIAPPKYSIVDKGGAQYIAIEVGKINALYLATLDQVLRQLSDDDSGLKDRVFFREVHPRVWLRSTEAQLLQRLLAESLTIGKSTLSSEFHQRFMPFLGGEERRIYSRANHVVFGRRGAGKSSLVLYACNQAKRGNVPFAWIALQQYRGRQDLLVVPQVLYEVIDAMVSYEPDSGRVQGLRSLVLKLEERGRNLTKSDINLQLPVFARYFVPFVREKGDFYLFLDDLHLLHPSLQSYFLSAMYSFARGNSIHLKITAIEHLTSLYNEAEREGLQTPGDAQVIRLDYNLVNPAAARDHIQQVLGSYVRYVGIPSVASLCGKAVVDRLVWVSAGVPRDALYIFNNAMTKAIAATRRKEIATTDVNMAAAESLTEKESYISDDVAEDSTIVRKIIDDIKTFCLQEIRCNAFLVHIDASDRRYELIKKISDLRFIHVLHPGITPEKAGEKYEALLLDYAFYIGFRKAPSVKEFKSELEQPSAKELRRLSRYKYEERIDLADAAS